MFGRGSRGRGSADDDDDNDDDYRDARENGRRLKEQLPARLKNAPEWKREKKHEYTFEDWREEWQEWFEAVEPLGTTAATAAADLFFSLDRLDRKVVRKNLTKEERKQPEKLFDLLAQEHAKYDEDLLYKSYRDMRDFKRHGNMAAEEFITNFDVNLKEFEGRASDDEELVKYPNVVKGYMLLDAVSYTHLTLPTKRIV